MSRRGIKSTKPKAITVCLPIDLWPEVDQQLIERARNDNLLEDGGFGKNWRPSTTEKYIRDYGRWLAWLRKTRPDVFEAPPLERLTRENVKLYVSDLQAKVAPYSVATFVRGLGSIAWAFSESDEYYWIARYARRLAYRAVPVRNKRKLVKPTYDLVALGMKLMSNARMTESEYRSALGFRNGLIIALLAYRPIRRANISGITIGRHLAKGETSYVLRFSAHETKQHKDIEIPVPESLTTAMLEYLQRYRPTLAKRPPLAGTSGDALWVAGDGGALSHWGLYAMVRNVTGEEFGEALNPHIFRDCAATTVALDDPEQIEIVADVLGHSNLATMARHYNQARCIDASRRVQDHVKEIRRAAREHSR